MEKQTTFCWSSFITQETNPWYGSSKKQINVCGLTDIVITQLTHNRGTYTLPNCLSLTEEQRLINIESN